LPLQRTDLVLVSKGLQQAKNSIEKELAASRKAWPAVANGFPRTTTEPTLSRLGAASKSAKAVVVPSFVVHATELTGPAAGIAGQFASYLGLTQHGWEVIEASVKQSSSTSPSARQFLHSNLSLYVDSVYDAHFYLAAIGQSLSIGYLKLGASTAFGSALTQSQISELARFYSPSTRLTPHPYLATGT
jgi:hypothetical protein